MNIPNMPNLQHKLVESDGTMHWSWHQMQRQLITELQQNLSQEGYVFPQRSSQAVQQLSGAKHVSKILYDSDAQAMKVNNTGTFEEIYTRPPQLSTIQRTAIPASKINGSWVYDTDLNKLYYGINQTWKEVAFT